jgi:hypothetical protein
MMRSRQQLRPTFYRVRVAVCGVQGLLITGVLLWYSYREFAVGDFDVFVHVQRAMDCLNPLVRFAIAFTGAYPVLWRLTEHVVPGTGGNAFAVAGLLFMLGIDLIGGPVTTFFFFTAAQRITTKVKKIYGIYRGQMG